jgi:hypothetical protein
MLSWNDQKDRVAIAQMNAELRNAQLELLSAQCATDSLRLRFSLPDIARYASRDVLQKAIASAGAMNHYYVSVEKQIPGVDAVAETACKGPDRQLILETTARMGDYLRQQRNRYFPAGKPLPGRHKTTLRNFFSPGLLERARVVELDGARIPAPTFYSELKARGVAKLPEITHMHSLTFLDVVVFNEKISERGLFHGLVHAVQFQILGVDRYTTLFVRGFLNTNSHATVPLEAHAFALDSRFAQFPADAFSVEEQVRLWVEEGRY